MLKISILGITGSIGQSTLNIIKRFPGKFRIVSAQCHSNLLLLSKILDQFPIEKVFITNSKLSLTAIKAKFPATKFIQETSLDKAYREILLSVPVDRVVNGIVGIAGLKPTLICLEEKIDLAIANKESLVVAGSLLIDLRKKAGSLFVPVDSEHNAIFQLLENRFNYSVSSRVTNDSKNYNALDSIVLTSSGGPFLNTSLSELENVTPAQAIKHPNWSMGPKISVDSANMVNKALEILEAHYLFELPMEKVKVVVHPQSIIHGLITLKDGASMAYMCPPSMEFPIAHSLFFPAPVLEEVKSVSLTDYPELQFRKVDENKFPAISLAYDVGKLGGTAPAIYNGANEAAVDLFLKGKIPFPGIIDYIKKALDSISVVDVNYIEDSLDADRQARELVYRLM